MMSFRGLIYTSGAERHRRCAKSVFFRGENADILNGKQLRQAENRFSARQQEVFEKALGIFDGGLYFEKGVQYLRDLSYDYHANGKSSIRNDV